MKYIKWDWKQQINCLHEGTAIKVQNGAAFRVTPPSKTRMLCGLTSFLLLLLRAHTARPVLVAETLVEIVALTTVVTFVCSVSIRGWALGRLLVRALRSEERGGV